MCDRCRRRDLMDSQMARNQHLQQLNIIKQSIKLPRLSPKSILVEARQMYSPSCCFLPGSGEPMCSLWKSLVKGPCDCRVIWRLTSLVVGTAMTICGSQMVDLRSSQYPQYGWSNDYLLVLRRSMESENIFPVSMAQQLGRGTHPLVCLPLVSLLATASALCIVASN